MRLYSSPESIANGEASALAILETVLAVAAYWGFAWYFDTYLYLLISVTVAPFLLLRSPQSVEQGAAWFRAYLGNETEGTPEHEWATVAGTAIALTAIVLAIAPLLLDGYAGWPLFGHAILLGGGAAYGSFAGGAMLSQLIGGRVFQAR